MTTTNEPEIPLDTRISDRREDLDGSARASNKRRPRVVTDDQLRELLAWRGAWLEWRTEMPKTTLRQLATELGLRYSTAHYVLYKRNPYKKRSPAAIATGSDNESK